MSINHFFLLLAVATSVAAVLYLISRPIDQSMSELESDAKRRWLDAADLIEAAGKESVERIRRARMTLNARSLASLPVLASDSLGGSSGAALASFTGKDGDDFSAYRAPSTEAWGADHSECLISSRFFETSASLDSGLSGINPATGLPMIGMIDAGGNPYGVDLHSSIHSSTDWGTNFDSGSSFDAGAFGSSWDS